MELSDYGIRMTIQFMRDAWYRHIQVSIQFVAVSQMKLYFQDGQMAKSEHIESIIAHFYGKLTMLISMVSQLFVWVTIKNSSVPEVSKENVASGKLEAENLYLT